MIQRRKGKGFAMSVEIERKFLVTGDGWRACAFDSEMIHDGAISEGNGAKVRVRLAGGRAWLTIKSDRSGPSRLEFEYEIPPADAEEMLERLCAENVFVKTRFKIRHGGNIWLVDVYGAQLSGIVLAEIELQNENQSFELPEWAGQEVTYNSRFHKRMMGRLCHEAGRPLSVSELLQGDIVDRMKKAV
jgi:CYTH domain-containing protein